MKLGAEPKKIAVLVGLLVVAVVVFLLNSGSSPETSYTPPAASPAGTPSAGPGVATPAPAATAQTRGRATMEFRPSLRPKRGESRPDPMTIDPTLRLDVLAKLQSVTVAGPHRSLFDFSQAPPPKPDASKAIADKKPVPNPLVPVKPPTEQAKADPPKPSAPPIPLKFFGYVSPQGNPAKRAFFLEGEEIHVVHEGDLVKKRYKIVRIGVNSVVVEDTQFGAQQTLPLEEAQSS